MVPLSSTLGGPIRPPPKQTVMQTPFTPYFKSASLFLTQVSREPFTPLYPMPFVAPDCTEYWVGRSCQFIYRWHDGFDVFVASLEARIGNPTSMAIDLPVESFLTDLHLVYQLAGETRLPGLALPGRHQTQVYAVPAKGTLRIRAGSGDQRYALFVAVPKGAWVSRNPPDPANPLGKLLHCIRESYSEHRMLTPTPISSTVQLWLHLLLTSPRYLRMQMDNALNHPIANLIEVHLTEYGNQQRADSEAAIAADARRFVAELFTRLNDGNPPTTEAVADALHISPERLRKVHYLHCGQKFQHYIVAARLEEAKNRLRQGIPISAITFALGWTDDPHFVNQFKKHTGLTPSEYVKLTSLQ